MQNKRKNIKQIFRTSKGHPAKLPDALSIRVSSYYDTIVKTRKKGFQETAHFQQISRNPLF